MMIIDSQVHAYEANTPKRPWHSVPNWPNHVTGDEMVAAMDKVGVDGAIFISAFSMYRYDASYAVEVQRAHPDRFAIVKPVDPDDPAVGDVIAGWKQTPGAVGIRIMMTKESKRGPNAFPGHQYRLDWRRAEGGGNWYYSADLDMEGWLCPALFRYFSDAPMSLYAQIKARA
jgi:predicted TIM-barrel fold metal-dependent hydrolase